MTNIIHQKVQIQHDFAVLFTVESSLLDALNEDLRKYKAVDHSVLSANALNIIRC